MTRLVINRMCQERHKRALKSKREWRALPMRVVQQAHPCVQPIAAFFLSLMLPAHPGNAKLLCQTQV